MKTLRGCRSPVQEPASFLLKQDVGFADITVADPRGENEGKSRWQSVFSGGRRTNSNSDCERVDLISFSKHLSLV